VRKLSEFSYDPFSPEAMADPYPAYRVLREEHPFYRLPEYGAWAVSRFADVHEILSDQEGRYTTTEKNVPLGRWELVVGNGGTPPPPQLEPLPMFSFLASPEHEQIRSLAVPPLRPRSAASLEPFVRELVGARLDELLGQGEFDLTRDYGAIVSAGVMCRVWGLPPERAARVRDLINLAGGRPDGEQSMDGAEASAELIGMLAEVVAERRAAGADGELPGVDRLIKAEVDGRPLSDEEVATQVFAIVFGGTETVPKVVAHGLMELWRHPDQLAAVRAGDLAENSRVAFEEMLRFCAPAQWFMRTATADTVVSGQEIARGDRLILLLASANRDEREFEAPERFRWDRPIERHLAFGHGGLFCIGVHVARLEGRILVEEFLRRAPAYEIDLARAERPASSFQLGYAAMPVAVG
jgi:cytochrome P450